MDARHEVTELLAAARGGDAGALDRMLPLVYEELRRIAHRQLRGERPGHTLKTTALVHEAYLRLVDQTRIAWGDRVHFYGAPAGAMRRILIDSARRRRAGKRGAGARAVQLDDVDLPIEERAELDPRLARAMECRYFGGLTDDETAAVLGVTSRTVRRDWVKAKGWLFLGELQR